MKKIVLLLALCLSMLNLLYAQKSVPVDANGKKIVNLTQAGTLKKQISKKEIPQITELIIAGDLNGDDMKYLSKLTVLKTIDITNAHILLFDINEITPILSVKKVISKANQTAYTKLLQEQYEKYFNEVDYSSFDNISSVNNDKELITYYTDIVKNNHAIPYLFTKLFPNIEQYEIKITEPPTQKRFVGNIPDTLLFSITSFVIPNESDREAAQCIGFQVDPLLLNIDNRILLREYVEQLNENADNYVQFQTDSPQLLVKESAVLLDRNVKNEYCHVICDFNGKQDVLKKAICLYTSAISMFNLDQITIPKNLKYIINDRSNAVINTKSLIIQDSDDLLFIGEQAFANSDIKKLEFNRPVYISGGAFRKAKPEEIIFNKDVYLYKWIFNDDAYPETIVFNDDVSYLDERFVLKAKRVQFNKIPKNFLVYKATVYGGAVTTYDTKPVYDVVLIPKGTKKQFAEKGISNNVYETCGHPISLNITVERPGTIMSYLSQDMFIDVDSLTITGILYETDLSIISNCKYLSYLDLSKTYITYSPEELERQKKQKEENYALFSLLGYANESLYNDNQRSTIDYECTQLMLELAKSSIDFNEGKKGCIVPYGSLNSMKYLKTVKLPLRATDIYTSFVNCTSLMTVEFPMYLEGVYGSAFEGCSSLKHIAFPKSTIAISSKAFAGCDSIEEVDLSNLTFTSNVKGLFSRCEGIKVMKYPKGITNVESLAGGSDCEYFFQEPLSNLNYNTNGKYKNRKYHLKNTTPPSSERYYNKPTGDVFYIPKGSTTSYFNKYGSSNTYIEE